jgi:hypothetical protein
MLELYERRSSHKTRRKRRYAHIRFTVLIFPLKMSGRLPDWVVHDDAPIDAGVVSLQIGGDTAGFVLLSLCVYVFIVVFRISLLIGLYE